MNFKRLFALLMITSLSGSICFAQKQVLYKQIDSTKLYMDVYYPVQVDSSIHYPAMIFFFGGGWVRGDRAQFINHAQYFSKRGLTCFLVDYRTKNKDNSTPFESLKDAKSAIRYLRKHADKFNIDTSKIIAVGGSAGGQLAAASALIEDYNEASDDMSISPKPNALVLFNPVVDNGPGGYGYERIGDEYKDFSPLHNIKEGAPPTIIFLGTKDALVPVETAEYFKKVMERVKSRCELELYEGEAHGFFNYQNFEYYRKTVSKTDEFLQSLNFLSKEPQIEIK